MQERLGWCQNSDLFCIFQCKYFFQFVSTVFLFTEHHWEESGFSFFTLLQQMLMHSTGPSSNPRGAPPMSDLQQDFMLLITTLLAQQLSHFSILLTDSQPLFHPPHLVPTSLVCAWGWYREQCQETESQDQEYLLLSPHPLRSSLYHRPSSGSSGMNFHIFNISHYNLRNE